MNPRPKENVITSQAYQREVRKLPCIRCGVVGFTQFCHSDEGKGIGIKTDDRRGWPGCGPHFVGLKLVSGCHHDIGTSGFLTRAQRRELEVNYSARTRATIIADGNWPDGLPRWDESKGTKNDSNNT